MLAETNSPVTVLVADDSADVRAMVCAFLARLGHRSIEACNGEEAVALYLQHDPDLVLMDIVMPKMGGYEATRRIKAATHIRWIPVILLSALSHEEDVVAGFDAGADDYLTLPLSFRLFAARIGALIHGVRADRRRQMLIRRLEATGAAIIDGLVTLDCHGRVLDCNPAAQRVFGCSEAGLVGNPLPVMFGESAGGETSSFRMPALGRTHDMLGRRADGSIFPIEVGLTELPAQGSPRVIAVLRDVTERKAGEAQLRESLEKLSLLYHSSELGLVLCDMDGRFVQCNHSFAQLLGHEEEAVLGMDAATVTPPEYTPQEIEQIGQIARTGRFGPYEKEFIRADGTAVPVLLHGSRITGADGRRYVWSVVQDISERRRIEREQREAAERLERYREENEQEAELAKSMIERQLKRDALGDERLRYSVVAAKRFSGDVVAARRSPSGRLYLMLADATGHGLAAAVSVLPLLSLFYRFVAHDVALPALVGELNNEVKRVAPIGRFVAATLLCIDESDGSGEIWVGGTPPALLLDESGRAVGRFHSHQLPLGIVDSTPLITRPELFEWTGARQLVLVSDGVIEAENAAGEAFGEQRMIDTLASAPPGMHRLDWLQAALAAHLGDRPPFDDMSTVLVDCIKTASLATCHEI